MKKEGNRKKRTNDNSKWSTDNAIEVSSAMA